MFKRFTYTINDFGTDDCVEYDKRGIVQILPQAQQHKRTLNNST